MVPKTHLLDEGPWETLRLSIKSSLTLDADLDQRGAGLHLYSRSFLCRRIALV